MKTFDITITDEYNTITTMKCDNSTEFKELNITQHIIGESNIRIQLDKDCIQLGAITLTGLEKKLFLEFINQ